jgi:hypothetical protein
VISHAGDLARRLARYAEAVCRHYLSNGCRRGRYWVIGDAMNTPGRSLYVRLTGPDSGPGAAGKWTDAASPSEHGDLLDLIRLNRNLNGLGEAMNEARCFLALPQPATPAPVSQAPSTTHRSPDAARRLFAASCPIPGTPAEAYCALAASPHDSTGPPCATIRQSTTAQARTLPTKAGRRYLLP